jgi:integrase
VADKLAARTALTFGELADDYVERHAKVHKKSWREDQRQLNGKDLKPWRNRPAAEINRADVRRVLDSMVAPPRSAPVAANRLRAVLRKLFNWAIQQERLEHNPAASIPKPGRERARERVLSEDEIRRVWSACETQRPLVSAWFRLRLVTAQRGAELLQMRWQDIDESASWWTIPGEFAKNGRAHRVYLSTMARAILTAVPRAHNVWVFPLSAMGDHRHVARRIAVPKRANVVDFRGHDLRRTAATFMATDGITRFVLGRVLNHADSGITAVYDRASYDAEKRHALTVWSDKLQAILAAQPTPEFPPQAIADN